MRILPVLASDSYKQFHVQMYPSGLQTLYSNFTPRSFKFMQTDRAVWFGLQYYVKEYLIKQWNEQFFQVPLEDVVAEYKRFHKHFSGVPDIDTTHIEALHKHGCLPLLIKSLPEGAKVKEKVPTYTIQNTEPGFGWLVNFLETQMSTVIWDMTVIATIGYQYRNLLEKWAIKTTGSTEGVQWQGHDFSMRGRSSMESAQNQAAWLLSFTGTDTIPAVLMLEEYYNANMELELVGASVPATEHSVMTSYGKEDELGAFTRILDQFPSGIVSVVSDSFDYWSVVTEFTVKLKDRILAREGKLVLRPDSGDPVRIVAGYRIGTLKEYIKDQDADEPKYIECIFEDGKYYINPKNVGPDKYELTEEISEAEAHGSIEMLWRVFGGTTTKQKYRVLDPRIGLIYGDSITLERAKEICERLAEKNFASTNVVFGVGSYTMNRNTRDSLGIAVKSTYCTLEPRYTDEQTLEYLTQLGYRYTLEDFQETAIKEGFRYIEKDKQWKLKGDSVIKREIFKDPLTDNGLKKSAKGLLRVDNVDGEYILTDRVTEDQERGGALTAVFYNGLLTKDLSLADIRKTLYPNAK